MKVALTGATGYIGSHVLTELQDHGHEVTALVRDNTQADIVKARGATPAVADLYDRPAVAGWLGKADGAIHTASPGDATSAGATGTRGAVIVASTAYGDGGGGTPGVLLGSPREDAGNLIMLGWSPSHPSLVDEFRHGSYRK
jgi:uncharacterized protein YbjT (DUF2867 family)